MWQVFKILDIYKRVKELKVPARVAYKFNKLCTDLESDSNFYQEQLTKVIEEYGEREEDGSFKRTPDNGVQIKEGLIEAAQKEIDALWILEVDVPDINFSLEEFDGLQLSIEDFNFMLPFIKED